MSQPANPAPGTAHFKSDWKIAAAELLWDRNPRNPQRAATIAGNFRGFERLQKRLRRAARP